MTITWPRPNRSLGTLDALGITGIVGLLVARFVPLARLPGWGCVIRSYFDWPCLGCGLTRVADRMSHFNVAGAWDANPLGTIAAALFMVAAVWTVLHLGFKVPVPDIQLNDREWLRMRLFLAAVVLVNYAWVVVKYRHPEWVGAV